MVSAAALPFFMAIAPAPMNVFMALLILSFGLNKVLRKEKLVFPAPLLLPLGGLLLLTCVSLLHSVNYFDTLKGGILRLVSYILILLVIAEKARDKALLKWIIIASSLGVALVSLDGVWQVFTGKDFIRGYVPVLNIGLARATASFKDSNVMGVYLSALSPLLFGLTLYHFKGGRRIIFGCLSLLALVGIGLTYSRPTLLAIYITLWFLAWVRKDRLVIGALVLLTLLSPFVLPRSVKEWAKEVEYNPLRMMCNDDRIAIYRNSLRMIRAHPLIGVGANTFMKNYKRYKEYPEYRNVVTIDYIYAHNNFLHLAGELGLLGLTVFLWLLYRVFRRGRAIYKKPTDNYERVIVLSVLACLISFLVNGLTESSLYYSRVAVLFWYLIGLLFSFDKPVYENK
jgi:O-antigen ligase